MDITAVAERALVITLAAPTLCVKQATKMFPLRQLAALVGSELEVG